jgi:hypothetical protein
MAALEKERSFFFLCVLLQYYSLYIYKVYSGFLHQLCKQGHLPQTGCIKQLKCLKTPLPLLYCMYFDLMHKDLYMIYTKISRIWYWSENKLFFILPSQFLYLSFMFCFQLICISTIHTLINAVLWIFCYFSSFRMKVVLLVVPFWGWVKLAK